MPHLRRLLLIVGGLLLLSSPARAAYPTYQGPVADEASALSTGQVNGLLSALQEQQATLGVTGTILVLPAQDTWQLELWGERCLAEWQAQGVVPDKSWLLVAVPSQHRFALSFDPVLTKELEPWTAEQLRARAAVQFEASAMYLGASEIIAHLNQAKELQPRRGFFNNRWPWVFAGLVILTVTILRMIRQRNIELKSAA